MTHGHDNDAGKETVIVVGAGIAGVRAAIAVRESGFDGRIVLLSEERHFPYDRPPLSKDVLSKPGHENAIALTSQQDLDRAAIELKLGVGCARIERGEQRLVLSDESTIRYDRLILATGSRLRTLPELPPGSAGVHYMRTLDDALRLRDAAETARSVVIVGAGVIGLEVAATLANGERRILVVDPADRVMSRAASPVLSRFLEKTHKAAGVEFALGSTIRDIRSDGTVRHITLDNGIELEADTIVVGIGVVPNVEIAVEAGLAADGKGIETDGLGQTSDPTIFAAGEVAYHFNAGLSRQDRQETWAHAAAHGAHVGHAVGGRSDLDDYCEQSSYWSDQLDIAVQVFGLGSGEIDLVRGDEADGPFLVFHITGGRIVGVTSVNAARELRTAKKLVGRSVENLVGLSDPSVPLKNLVDREVVA